MLVIDPRAGSERLAPLLRLRGLPVESRLLPSGDVELQGNGPGNQPVLVGIEYKTVADVLACERDGRFADQLRRMRDRYQVCWLLVEGRMEPGPKGELLVLERGRFVPARGKHSYAEIASWLLTMVQAGGVLLWRTSNIEESVSWLAVLYSWWVRRDWESHQSHLAIYQPPPVTFLPPTPAELVARSMPGIGGEKAREAAARFETPHALTSATAEEWMSVPGIGKKIAEKAVTWCKGKP